MIRTLARRVWHRYRHVLTLCASHSSCGRGTRLTITWTRSTVSSVQDVQGLAGWTNHCWAISTRQTSQAVRWTRCRQKNKLIFLTIWHWPLLQYEKKQVEETNNDNDNITTIVMGTSIRYGAHQHKKVWNFKESNSVNYFVPEHVPSAFTP